MEKIFEADIIPGRRRLDRQAISHYIVQVAEHNVSSSSSASYLTSSLTVFFQVNSSEGRPEAALFSRLNEPQLHIKNVRSSPSFQTYLLNEFLLDWKVQRTGCRYQYESN